MRPFVPLDVELQGRHLVEASAGTGKTHAITTLVLRAVLELGQDIEQISVLTFTRAATAELLSRVRSRLEQVHAIAHGWGMDDVDVATLVQRVGLPLARARATAALAGLDGASISTIHQFCTRVLTAWPFETNSPLHATAASASGVDARRALHDAWSAAVHDLPPGLEGLVGVTAQRLQSLRNLVTVLVGQPLVEVRPAGPPPDPSLVLQASQDLATAWDTLEPTLSAWIGGLDSTYGLAPLVRLLRAPPRTTTLASDIVALLRELTEGRHRRRPPQDVAGAIATFLEVHDRVDEALSTFTARFVAGIVRAAATALEQRRAESEFVTFDALILAVHRALVAGPAAPALARAARTQWPILLVDEFQDTDPLQWAIFDAIYRDGGTLFLIGDPKQAIYGFRGADIATYLAARASVPADRRWTLLTNRRSDPSVVDAVNRLFGRMGQRPFLLDGIGFDPAVAHRTEPGWTAAGPLPGLTFVRAPDTRSAWDPKVPSLVAREVVALLGSEATLVDRSGKSRPLGPEDIAVLVRKNDQIADIVHALAAWKVPARTPGHRLLWSDAVGREATTLVAALAQPHHEPSVRAALLTRALGHDTTTLETASSEPARWEALVAPIFDASARWHRWGLLAALRGLLDTPEVGLRLAALEGGARWLLDLHHAAELADGVALRDRLDPPALVALLVAAQEDPSRLSLDEDATRIRPLPGERGVVVDTLHQSKGLEYGVVILPTLATGDAIQEVATRYHEGERAILDFRRPPRAEAARAALDEKLSDELRLAYVGLTRARHGVIAFVGRTRHTETSPLASLLFADDQLRPGSGDTWKKAVERMHAGAGALVRDGDRVLVSRDPVSGTSFRPYEPVPPGLPPSLLSAPTWLRPRRVGSFSGLVRGASHDEGRDVDAVDIAEPVTQAPDAAIRLATFPRGAETGTLLHLVFEGLDFRHPTDLGARVDTLLDRGGLDPSFRGPLLEQIADVLDTPLGGELGRLADVGPHDRIDEMPFYLPVRGRLDPARLAEPFAATGAPHLADAVRRLSFDAFEGHLKGFVDLVLRHDGRFYVLDYKSNHLGELAADYAPERLLAPMAEHHYALQYHLYAVALFRHLRVRLPNFDPDQHWGGVRYLFLRGMGREMPPGQGIFADRPPAERIQRLSEVFDG